MKKHDIRLRSPDRKKDLDDLCDLVAKVFSGNGYFDFRDACRKSYIGNSHYDWDASTIGIIGDEIVTHYGVWGYDMRIGSAIVRCAGIGAVATHGDYRKRGLMAKTIPVCLDAMAANGYDVSILFGIPDFYHKFGYTRCWARGNHTVRVESLPKEKPAGKVIKFKDMLRKDITAIYTRTQRRVTCSAVRPTYNRAGRGWSEFTCYRWTDSKGKTTGYIVCQTGNDVLECHEAGGDADEVLRVLAALARKAHFRKVKFRSLYYLHPVLRKVRSGDCTVETDYHRSSGAMIRIIDLESCLRKVSSELSRRLKASQMAKWRGRLTIQNSLKRVNLAIEKSGVRVCGGPVSKHAIRGGDEIAQFLIGTDEPEQIVEWFGTKVTGDAKKLIGILFPRQHPTLCSWDGY